MAGDQTHNNVVKITKREKVKPCSPTPKHLRTLKLSKLDQLAVDMYVPLVLFYPSDPNLTSQESPFETASQKFEHLRKTLAKVLVQYYPLAGRLRDNMFVECNDEGVEFFEAAAEFSMADLLGKSPELDDVTRLVATLPETKEGSLGGCTFLVQVTIFTCGAIALGLSVSHKVFDACSLASFVDTWAKLARDEEAIISKPEFGYMTSLFPPSIDLSSSSSATSGVLLAEDKCVTRRYFFGPKKIAALKSKAASIDSVKNPSRVEAVSGLIWNCVEDRVTSKSPEIVPRKSVWCHYVNMRTRFSPALSSSVLGNLVGVYSVGTTEEREHGEIGLQGLVGKLRRAIKEVKTKYAKPDYLKAIEREYEEYVEIMNSGDKVDIYHLSSWCRFGLYGIDFGWEKPVWASLVNSSFKNNIYLMDSNDGNGIEVWFYLTEEDMAVIETNEEFLAFATLNPNVV